MCNNVPVNWAIRKSFSFIAVKISKLIGLKGTWPIISHFKFPKKPFPSYELPRDT